MTTLIHGPQRGLKIVDDQVAYQALMPGLESAYEDTAKTRGAFTQNAPPAFGGLDSNAQLFLAGLTPQHVGWEVVVRESRRCIRIDFEEVNELLARIGLPSMPEHIDRIDGITDPTAALRLSAIRAALLNSGAPAWCSEVMSENVFGQPAVSEDVVSVDEPTAQFGFRNVKRKYFYIPGPTDLAAATEDGCHYCVIYRGRHATRPRLDYMTNESQQVFAVRHRDIQQLLKRPNATGVPTLSEASNGRVYYTAQSIHDTRDIVHALGLNRTSLRDMTCIARGEYSYYKPSDGERRTK